MAFQAIYDKQDDIPADHQEHYVERNGRFELETDFKALGRDVEGLTASQARLKKQRTELQAKVDALKPLERFAKLADVEGFDPDEIETLMASAGGSDNKEAIEALQRKHQKELDKLKQQVTDSDATASTAVQEKDSYIITNELQSSAITAGVRKKSLTDVVALNRDDVSIVDGKVMFVDAEGDPTLSPLEYFSGDYKKEKSHFFEPEGTGGSGQPSNGGNNSGGAAKAYKADSPLKDKVAAIASKIESGKGS